MAQYAQEKDRNGATLRRQFNAMRSQAEFAELFDLYDRQVKRLSDAKAAKRGKSQSKSKKSGVGEIAHQLSAKTAIAKRSENGSQQRTRSNDVSQYSSTAVRK